MAGQKLTELTSIVPAQTDLVYIVHDPSSTPAPRKATVANLAQSALAEPGAPNVSVQGVAGTTVYHYQIVANNATGSTSAGKFSTTTDGNATLTGSNFNRLAWSAVTGAASYDVYRQVGTDMIWKRIATALAAVTLDDTGIAGTEAVPPTINTTAPVAFGGLERAIIHLTDTQIRTPTGLCEIVAHPGDGVMFVLHNGFGIAEILGAYDSASVSASDSVIEIQVGAYGGQTGSLYLLNAAVAAVFTNVANSVFGLPPNVLVSAGYGVSAPGVLGNVVDQPIGLQIYSGTGTFTGGDPRNMLTIYVWFTRIRV